MSTKIVTVITRFKPLMLTMKVGDRHVALPWALPVAARVTFDK